MQVLLIHNQTDLSKKIAFLIESTYSAKVFFAESLTEAKTFLESHAAETHLILLLSTPLKEEIEQFQLKFKTIPLILTASEHFPINTPLTPPVVGIITPPDYFLGIAQTIQTLITKGLLEQGQCEQGQVRINTKLLLSVSPLRGDIYIRLSEQKFVKLFQEGDLFDLADLEKYTVKKGIEYLYIRQSQCQEFIQKYRLELQKFFLQENLTLEAIGRFGETAHETIQTLNKQLGFCKDVQELTKTHVNLTVKAMGKDPNLAEILEKLKLSEGKYIATHSTLCAYLSCAIASQLQWGSESTFHKLSLAAFLHDMTLENHSLAAISTLEELQRAGSSFTAEEIRAYKDHPTQAAEMAKRMTEVPPDVDTIIHQHHEKPDGTGFPRGIGHTYIAPLSSVFIIAHELGDCLLKTDQDFNLDSFLNQVRDKYKSHKFKKSIDSIEVLHKIKNFSESLKKQKEST